jgi:dTDP-4-dehydrorhamnose 3,5-epimerase
MQFAETELPGAYVITLDRLEDERGFFARTYCCDEFACHGLNASIAQCSVSYNRRKGTLRGLHYQAAPRPEAKLVRCTRGALYDVIVDLRPDSRTRGRWLGVELTADNGQMLYVPEGFAHGFQTLAADTEVYYQISESYHPELARGVRWDDPVLAIHWPDDERTISARDQQLPSFEP